MVQEPPHQPEVQDDLQALHHVAPDERQQRLRNHSPTQAETQPPEPGILFRPDDTVQQDLVRPFPTPLTFRW